MDEPTASLSEEEVRRLFKIIADLKAQGITIIYISHRLEEIMELADYVTVLRDGKHIDTKPRSEINTRQDLIQMMIGKVIVEDYQPNDVDESVKLVEVKNMNNRKLKNVNFDLYKGEILGFYGLIGAGKTEIARALFGVDPYSGEVIVDGTPVKTEGARAALSNGIALVPEERRTQGVATSLSILDNTPMMNYNTIANKGIVNKKKEVELAQEYIEKVGTACRNEQQSVAYLSGGNQQKVVISKCLNAQPKVLLLDEPTRGVDVGAKYEIYSLILDLAKRGSGVLCISSEMEELMGICDRILVMNNGRFTGEVKKGEFDQKLIMDYALKEGE
jgi:ABC-type sugar transport system ATPase subunit